jgi:hypothetical protein
MFERDRDRMKKQKQQPHEHASDDNRPFLTTYELGVASRYHPHFYRRRVAMFLHVGHNHIFRVIRNT